MKSLIHELHRRSLWQVLGIYLAASWIVLQIVDVVGNNFGLPDWVAPAALVLLLLGLPIVLATAFVQEGVRKAASPERRQEDVPPSPESQASGDAPRSRHLLTWRNATLAGLAAFALLGLVTAGWFITRTMGIGPAATLVAAGVLDARDRVLVSEFGTASGDTVLAETATEALRVDLAQSQIVSIVEARAVAAALGRMDRPRDTRLDRNVATELAVREGIKAIIVGELSAAGSGYVLTAEVIGSAEGETLVSRRVTAASADDLLAAIDELSRKLRERIGESLRSTRADPPLERATTSSLEALRLFSQATRAIDIEGESARGIALLEQALEVDSTFALAWRKLAVEQRNNFYARSVWGRGFTKAFDLRDRLSDRERYLATASYYGFLTGDRERAITAYESMLALDPGDYYALNNAAVALNQLGRFEQAEEYAVRATGIVPDLRFSYIVALIAQVALGKFEDAQHTHDALAAALPGIPDIDTWGARLAFARGDYESARAGFAADLERRRGEPGARAGRSYELSLLSLLQGKLIESERLVSDMVAANQERGYPQARLVGAILVATLDSRARDVPAAGLARIEEVLADEALDALDVVDRPYLQLVAVYSDAGRAARARELLSEYQRAVPPNLVDRDAVLRSTGMIALAEGRPDEAIADFLQAEDGRCTRRCPELARAYDSSGRRDSALAVMERFVNTPDLGDGGRDSNNRAPFYERLGQLYDEKGDLENAAKYLAMFVELWADADEELQPRVRAAQARLEEILRERG